MRLGIDGRIYEATLRVVDDGSGVPADPPPGQGLANMAVRAARLGGTCVVEAGDPGGTVVDWSVPLDS